MAHAEEVQDPYFVYYSQSSCTKKNYIRPLILLTMTFKGQVEDLEFLIE